MRTLMVLTASLALSWACLAEDTLKSGPQAGDSVGPYNSKKVNNAEDGVAKGTTLCYTWRLQRRPVVMVFAQNADEHLTSLVSALETLVNENKDSQLAAVINLIGPEKAALEQQAEKFGQDLKAVPVVVPSDHQNGPPKWKLNSDAALTVFMYRNKKVIASFALPADKIDADAIKAITEAAATKLLGK